MNKLVEEKFANYPPLARKKLEMIRHCILEVASGNNLAVDETLKWNEPSYLVKGGSTVRFDWKPSRPDQCVVYFNCKTKLIETFKEIYSDDFLFEGNRAIVFHIDEPINLPALRHCVTLAFNYHRLKHLPLLGA